MQSPPALLPPPGAGPSVAAAPGAGPSAAPPPEKAEGAPCGSLPTARSLDRILERLELSESVRRSASAYFSSGEDIQIVKHEEIWI